MKSHDVFQSFVETGVDGRHSRNFECLLSMRNEQLNISECRQRSVPCRRVFSPLALLGFSFAQHIDDMTKFTQEVIV
jgi:hypothetical protein